MTTETLTLELLVHKVSSLETQIRAIGSEIAILKTQHLSSIYADKSELKRYFAQAFPDRVKPDQRWTIEQLQATLGNKLDDDELSQGINHMREE